MSLSRAKLLWVALLLLLLAASGVLLLIGSAARQAATAAGCDESLWSHTYHSQRLEVLERCVSVTGVIVDATHGKRRDGVRKEADGDCHGWLKLDAGQEKYINAGNTSDEEGNLVFEIVCMFRIKQADAVAACQGYKNKVKLPPVGSHVKMTGSWVMDDNHARWNELHPVSSIEVLSSPSHLRAAR